MEARELPHGAQLEVAHLTVSFGGITALQDVSLELRPGEVLGVIGPNGAGKTTLFNAICGFVTPQSGTITWGERRLTAGHPDRLAGAGIARTLQGVGLFPRLTVLENVMVGAHRFRRVRAWRALLALPGSDADEAQLRERARRALARVGCEQLEARLPGTLPYALQKRVALARALACEPELLLLDEPAGGLGASDLEDLARLIDSLRERVAVMLVDHHMDLVSSVCDRLVVLDFGRVIAAGEPPVVRRDPRVLEAYLGRSADREADGEVAASEEAGAG